MEISYFSGARKTMPGRKARPAKFAPEAGLVGSAVQFQTYDHGCAFEEHADVQQIAIGE